MRTDTRRKVLPKLIAGRVGETIKRKGGVSQACVGKSSSFIYDIHNIVN